MRRWRRLASSIIRLAAVMVLLALAACAKPAAVQRIAARYELCSGGCAGFSIEIEANGQYRIFQSPTAPDVVGTLTRIQRESTFGGLPLAAIERCVPPTGETPFDSLSLTAVLRDGSTRTCQETASGVSRGLAPDAAVRAYVRLMIGAITYSAFEPRREAIREALSGDTLSSARLVRGPCYGSCPSYTVDFTRDNQALIVDGYGRCQVQARARVPFERVREALLESDAAALEPAYPLISVDTPGATIVLRTASATYSSNGPDATAWGAPLRAAVERLDQLVLDTAWSPPLRPRHKIRQKCR